VLGFGSPTEDAVTIARIAGARDIVLAIATLTSLEDPRRLRSASVANAGADGGDALSFALSLRRGADRTAALRGLSAALPASVSSLWVAWRLR
jgi:hypothetical protein